MARNSTITVKILGDNKDFRKALDDSESRSSRFAGNVGRAVAAGLAAVAVGATAVGAASIKQASDLQESANAVAVTFGDEAADIAKLAEAAARGVGLSASEFNGLAVQFSAFAENVAGAGGDVSDVVDDISKRAADFASVMNLDVAEAARIFQSGLAGETEPLRKFGIDLSAAAVAAYAVENGIAASAKEMTEAQKVQARFGLLMEKTAKTQGDFANTSDSLANQQRILSATVKDLGAKIGASLLPILEKIATVVAERLVPYLERNLPGAIDAVKRAIVAVTPTLTALYVAFRAVVDFFRSNTPAIAALAAVVGGVLLAATVAYTVALYAQAAAFIAANAPIIAIIAVLAALVAGVVYAYQNFETFRTIVDAVRAWMVDELWPAIKATWEGIQSAITTAIAVVTAVVKTFVGVVSKLWAKFGADITAMAQNAWNTISAVVESVLGVIRGIIKTVTSLIRGDWQGVWDGLKQIVRAAWDGIKAVVSGAINAVKLQLSIAWTAVRTAAFNGWEKVKDTITRAGDSIVRFIGGMPGRLADLAGDFLSAGLSLGSAILEGIVDGIAGAVSIVGSIGTAVANAVRSAVKTAANFVIDQVNNALEFTINGPGFLPDVHLNPPDIPRFHTGGVVPGPVGTEVPIMALAGETVFTRDQMAALGTNVGGPVELGDETIRKLAHHMMAGVGVGVARSEAQLLAELRGGVR